MKKVLFAIAAVLGLSLALVATGCGGGGGGGSDDEEVASSGSSGSTSVSIPEFVLVQGVTVTGGINDSYVFINERTVNIPSLWVCTNEVTQAEYAAVMGSDPSYFASDPASGEIQEKRPVEQVSWYDTLVYCNRRSIAEHFTPCYTIGGKTNPDEWESVPTSSNTTWNNAECNWNANGYRLPTEAEWEYLARGGNTSNSGQTGFSGSNSVDNVAWYDINSDNKTHEVRKKTGNSFGLYDMSGNVSEWCWDYYERMSTDMPSTGPSSGSHLRTLRGGSCGSQRPGCYIMNRGYNFSEERHRNLGFRVVRTAD